ncbi:protein spinster-like protein 1 [Platysternon megacephalum]|uniref:Protein spinster-like protein 1 n=1 Tax=Platysternon megacephalum TaxID=55544 RepID=A0A4D9DRE7_9SAUR|nr:protein spinster-like protein 1 [Platysternon megacephalum]
MGCDDSSAPAGGAKPSAACVRAQSAPSPGHLCASLWGLPLRLSSPGLDSPGSPPVAGSAVGGRLDKAPAPMAIRAAEWSTALPSVGLGAVCLSSAVRTFQINRGAAAGFLLQALAALVGGVGFFWTPLGLTLAADSQSGTWVSTVVGLPLLAFGFHWLNGDHSTANILLGGALLLAAGLEYFTEEGRAMVAQSVTVVASITVLILSIFTMNFYGILGSLVLSTAGLLSGVKVETLLMLRKEAVLSCLLAAGNLAFQWAFRTQHLDLD